MRVTPFSRGSSKLLGDLVVGVRDDLPGLGIDQVARQGAPDHELGGNRQAFDAGLLQRADMLGVMRRPASTSCSSPSLISKFTVSPRRRSGTSVELDLRPRR